MVVEAVVAIGAGEVARSVLLTAFGFDSVIELLSGAALVWRLRMSSPAAPTKGSKHAELVARKIAAVLLVLLCPHRVFVGLAIKGFTSQWFSRG